MAEVVISNRALKDMKPMDAAMKRRIDDALRQLDRWPDTSADVKKLRGRDEYRMRVGRYRVLFHLENDGRKLFVDRIRPRGEAYQ